jgi:hypothetical protein
MLFHEYEQVFGWHTCKLLYLYRRPLNHAAFWDCYALSFVSADAKLCKVWYKQSHMLGEWSDGLKFGQGRRDAANFNYTAVNVASRNATPRVRIFGRNTVCTYRLTAVNTASLVEHCGHIVLMW